jgi:hypothetical protein
MADRRGTRFLVEVLFLLALAVALTLAKLRPLEIAGIMLLGWAIAAALEWAAWRSEPHYGSGLPPRYYVPRVNLPPAQPLEQVVTGYPEAQRDEAPTWIASAALRAEVLGEWPVAAAGVDAPAAVIDEGEADPWTLAELPPPPLGETGPDDAGPVDAGPDDAERAEPEQVEPTPKIERVPETKPETEAEPEPEAEPEGAPPPAPDLQPEAESGEEARPAPAAGRLARYSLDPLGEPLPRRRFGRRGAPEPPELEVAARPTGPRELPGAASRRD